MSAKTIIIESKLGKLAVCIGLGVFLSLPLYSAPIGVDGLLGTEWTGVTPAVVGYSPSAPTSNFSSPGNVNHKVGYKIYARADQDYVYGLFLANSTAGIGSDNFVNLYLDTNPSTGSDIGIELGNDRAFKPGVGGYYTGLSTLGMAYSSVLGGIEFAMPWSYFLNDPQAIGFNKISAVDNKLQFRMSQSFGYSVAGGSTYGNTRLGIVEYIPNSVPDAGTTWSILSIAMVGLFSLRRKLQA